VASAWANGPEWVAAIGTAGATILAATATFSEVRRRRRRQASQVSAWLGDLPPAPFGGGPAPYLQSDNALFIRNLSDGPVSRFTASVLDSGTRTVLADHAVQIVPPNETLEARLSRGGNRLGSDADLLLTYSFVDGAGRGWSRDTGSGRLVRRKPTW
jgi:hypothetical protein